jgi:hypothetical protein
MELLVLVISLAVLGIVANRFGCDSRDGFGAMAPSQGTSVKRWSDPADEQKLAHELLQAQRSRLAGRHVTATPLEQTRDDFSQAA